MLDRIHKLLLRLACWCRDTFDARRHPTVVVGVLAAIAGGVAALLKHALADCPSPAVAPIRLQVAFYAERFAELLNAEGPVCRPLIIKSFYLDYAFLLAYPFFLAALYLWLERWRRFEKPDATLRARQVGDRFGAQFFVVAPFVAAVLDAIPENTLLLWVASTIPATGPMSFSLPVKLAVFVASVGSSIKWLLLLLWAWGAVSELLSGPRGAVLRRARFSVLAVLLGALPLLIVPQGQDILQRLVEGMRPWTRITLSVFGIAFASYAVWRCGRALLEFKLEDRAWQASDWASYFAEDVPRILGIAMPVIVGAAFAQVADVLLWYILAAVGGAATLLAPERFAPLGKWLIRLPIVPTRWTKIPQFPGRIGSAMVANLFGAVVLLYQGVPWMLRGGYSDADVSLLAHHFAAWLCLVVAWWLYLYVYFRRAREIAKNDTASMTNEADFAQKVETLRAWSFDAEDVRAPLDRRLVIPVAIGLTASVVALIVFTGWSVPVGRFIGPLWVLSIFTANTVFFGSIAVWIHARYGIPVVRLALVTAVVCGLWNDNHAVTTTPRSRNADTARQQTTAEQRAIAVRKTIATHLAEWLATPERAALDTVPVVLVAAAGGGLRAAYWAAVALASIQDARPTFVNDVFAISSVSGGSVGGALFTALARDAGRNPKFMANCATRLPPPTTADTARASYSRCVRAFMSDDYLSPLLAKMLAPDLLQRFIPLPIRRFDRSAALEGSWTQSYLELTGASTFADGVLALAPDSATRNRIPVLLLNSTHVESGRRYIASPLAIEPGLLDAGDVLGVLDHDLRLTGAVHNSARFTYASPSGRLDRGDGQNYGRVVDGGYFENSGLVTLGEVYDAVTSWRPAGTARPRALRPVVIYLCNDPTTCDQTDPAPIDSLARVPSTSVNELLGPVRALLHTRDARASLARARLLGDSAHFVQLNVCRDSVPRIADSTRKDKARDRAVSPPLGWLLSTLAREWMDASIASAPRAGDGSCRKANVSALAKVMRLDSVPAAAGATALRSR